MITSHSFLLIKLFGVESFTKKRKVSGKFGLQGKVEGRCIFQEIQLGRIRGQYPGIV